MAGCNNLFFFPSREMRPADGLRFEDIQFQSQDGTALHGWYLPADKKFGSILFLHGNAENLSTHVWATTWLQAAGYSVFIFDYRGYGQSASDADLEGAFLDAQAAFNWLAGRETNKVIVYGQSLGGAIALGAFSNAEFTDRIAAFVFEGVFSSYRRIAREKLAAFFLTWPLQYPLSLLVSDQYAPDRMAASFRNIPTVVVHSEQDRIVPFHHGEELSRALGAPLWSTSRPSHGDAFIEEDLQRRLLDFFRNAG